MIVLGVFEWLCRVMSIQLNGLDGAFKLSADAERDSWLPMHCRYSLQIVLQYVVQAYSCNTCPERGSTAPSNVHTAAAAAAAAAGLHLQAADSSVCTCVQLYHD
jgi:hypothetical protein